MALSEPDPEPSRPWISRHRPRVSPDGRTGESEAIAVTGGFIGGGDLTTGAGAVWLRTDTAVARIDPADNRVTHLIELTPGSGSVAATDGALWITNHDHLAVHQVPLPLRD